MPMKIRQLEVNNIRFGKLEDNIRTPSQNIAFVYYQDERTRLNAITPHFITECYGMSREGPYYQTDRSRAFFNMQFATSSSSTRTIYTTQRYRLHTTSSRRSTPT